MVCSFGSVNCSTIVSDPAEVPLHWHWAWAVTWRSNDVCVGLWSITATVVIDHTSQYDHIRRCIHNSLYSSITGVVTNHFTIRSSTLISFQLLAKVWQFVLMEPELRVFNSQHAYCWVQCGTISISTLLKGGGAFTFYHLLTYHQANLSLTSWIFDRTSVHGNGMEGVSFVQYKAQLQQLADCMST